MLEQHGATELPVAEHWRERGSIILHVLADGEVIGALALADEVRAESREAVDALHALGITVVMITGDAEAVAHAVAADLGIDRVFAGVRPEDKSAKVQQLQSEGLSVAMVGDGVNDAPALAAADVGIAIGAGTDVAIGSAGVILASDDPRSVLSVIELSRASYRKMRQNLWWAAGYNLVSCRSRRASSPPSASCCRCRSAPCSCRCRRSSSRSTPSCCDGSTCGPRRASRRCSSAPEPTRWGAVENFRRPHRVAPD